MLRATDDSKGLARIFDFLPLFPRLAGFVQSYAMKLNRMLPLSPYFCYVNHNLVGFLLNSFHESFGVVYVFSKTNKASSFPAKDGRGICTAFSNSGFSVVTYLSIVLSSKAV